MLNCERDDLRTHWQQIINECGTCMYVLVIVETLVYESILQNGIII